MRFEMNISLFDTTQSKSSEFYKYHIMLTSIKVQKFDLFKTDSLTIRLGRNKFEESFMRFLKRLEK